VLHIPHSSRVVPREERKKLGSRRGRTAQHNGCHLDERSIAFTQKKTGAKIKVPIHSELLNYLLTRSVPDDGRRPVFPTLYKKPGPGKSGLSMSFKRLMARCGIADEIARHKTGDAGHNVSRLSFHSLRHGSTSALANADVAPDVRQKLTGHADAKSHAVYTHHDFAIVAEAIERIARLPKEEK
jgi:integrase